MLECACRNIFRPIARVKTYLEKSYQHAVPNK